jgi:hypothetical protein
MQCLKCPGNLTAAPLLRFPLADLLLALLFELSSFGVSDAFAGADFLAGQAVRVAMMRLCSSRTIFMRSFMPLLNVGAGHLDCSTRPSGGRDSC